MTITVITSLGTFHMMGEIVSRIVSSLFAEPIFTVIVAPAVSALVT